MKRLWWLAILSMILMLAAFSVVMAQDDAGFPITVVDQSGAEYTFAQPVERVICLSTDCIDNLYILDLHPIAIAEDLVIPYEMTYGDLPADLPLISTGGGYQPDFEQIIALEPEVVVTAIGTSFAREPLEATGNIDVLLTDPNTIEQTITNLRLLAQITNTQVQAETAIADFETVLADYQTLSPNDISFVVVFGMAGSETMYVNTTASKTCGAFNEYELAHCPAEMPDSAGPMAAFGLAEFTFESILETDPDIIFFMGVDDLGEDAPEMYEVLNSSPLWNALSAVQNDKVYNINAWNFVGTSSLTLFENTLDFAMPVLYPDLFSEEPQADEPSAAVSAAFPVTVVDESGAEYTFDQPVEQIVCLSPVCIGNLYALGLTPIGIADWVMDHYDELYGEMPEDMAIINTGGGMAPDVEQLIALEPEVVVGLRGMYEFIREPLETSSDTLNVLLYAPQTAEEMIASLQLMAAITGQQERGENAIQQFEEKLATYQARVPGDETVMIVFSNAGTETMLVATSSSQNCAVFMAYELAICPYEMPDNAGMWAAFGYAEFSYEAILEVDPDYILFVGVDETHSGGIAPEMIQELSEDPLWSALSAVQEARVFAVDPTYFNGASGITLIGRSADQTMQILYPDSVQ
jgi:iron complex transport system substrate-binding protein